MKKVALAVMLFASAALHSRVWALADSAAESDALSTACMILPQTAIREVVYRNAGWLVFLSEDKRWRAIGPRALPSAA